MAEENEKGKNSNIELILGDYKRGILHLAWPILISSVLTMAYNVADSIWVAGLGPDPLAAIGFVSPLFFILVGIGTGVGTGANSVISRYIGAKEYDNASNTAVHSMFIAVIVSIIGAIIMYILLPTLLNIMGAEGASFEYSMQYGRIVFTLMIVFIFCNTASGILRGEGDVKRAMYVMASLAVLNIILDPIFIYVFGMGIEGAAWASVLSASCSCLILFYWIMIKNDTFVDIRLEKFHASRSLTSSILSIALPSTTEVIIFSAIGITMNYILTLTSTSEAVAVCAVNMRLLQVFMVILVSFGLAMLTIIGASFGAKNYQRIEDTYYFTLRLVIVLSIVLLVILFIFAPQLSSLFAYNESADLLPQITSSLRLMSFWMVGLGVGSLTSSLFQGIGKGLLSLGITFIRSYLFVAIFVVLFAVVFKMADVGAYAGMSVGSVVGGVLTLLYSLWYIRRMKSNYDKN